MAECWAVTSSEQFARVAQLVEHTLGKGEVTGSIPVVSSESSGKGVGQVLERRGRVMGA